MAGCGAGLEFPLAPLAEQGRPGRLGASRSEARRVFPIPALKLTLPRFAPLLASSQRHGRSLFCACGPQQVCQGSKLIHYRQDWYQRRVRQRSSTKENA